ncbi:MAG: hypothetical protein ACYTFG_22145 [Planctomycetota bacterium]|jgi:hypothetical protein
MTKSRSIFILTLLSLLIPPLTTFADPGEDWIFADPGWDKSAEEELAESLYGVADLASWERNEPEGQVEERSRISLKSKPKRPERELLLEFTSPMESFEANSRAWHTANSLIALGNDFLGVEGQLDRSPFGRGFLLLSTAFLSGGLSYYSHEMGHTFEEVRKGARHDFRIDPGTLVTLGYPEYVKNFAPPDTDWSREEDCRATVGGLNQTTRNSRFAWEKAMTRGSWDFCSGLAFLEGKLDHLLQLFVGCQNPEGDNDANSYIAYLAQGEVGVTRDEYIAQALLADLLSWPVAEALAAIGGYGFTGNRERTVLHIPVARGFAVSPPLLSLHLTPAGGVYEIGLFMTLKDLPSFQVSLAHRANMPGESRVRGTRVGVKQHGLELFSIRGWRAAVSPYTYLTLTRSPVRRGFLIGAEFEAGTGAVGLSLRMEFGIRDLIRHQVLAQDEGFSAVMGLILRP